MKQLVDLYSHADYEKMIDTTIEGTGKIIGEYTKGNHLHNVVAFMAVVADGRADVYAALFKAIMLGFNAHLSVRETDEGISNLVRMLMSAGVIKIEQADEGRPN